MTKEQAKEKAVAALKLVGLEQLADENPYDPESEQSGKNGYCDFTRYGFCGREFRACDRYGARKKCSQMAQKRKCLHRRMFWSRQGLTSRI